MNYDQMREVINGASRIKEVQADLGRIKEENTSIVSTAHAMISLSNQELARHEERVRKTIANAGSMIRKRFGPVALPDLPKDVEKSIDKMMPNGKFSGVGTRVIDCMKIIVAMEKWYGNTSVDRCLINLYDQACVVAGIVANYTIPATPPAEF